MVWTGTVGEEIWEHIGADDDAPLGPSVERDPPSSFKTSSIVNGSETFDFCRQRQHWRRTGRVDGC